jgi:hypothetical protein
MDGQNGAKSSEVVWALVVLAVLAFMQWITP